MTAPQLWQVTQEWPWHKQEWPRHNFDSRMPMVQPGMKNGQSMKLNWHSRNTASQGCLKNDLATHLNTRMTTPKLWVKNDLATPPSPVLFPNMKLWLKLIQEICRTIKAMVQTCSNESHKLDYDIQTCLALEVKAMIQTKAYKLNRIEATNQAMA